MPLRISLQMRLYDPIESLRRAVRFRSVPSRCSNDTTFAMILQSPRKCRLIFRMNISAVSSGLLLIPHFFMVGHGFGGTSLSHHKINISSEKTFYIFIGCFSASADAIISFDYNTYSAQLPLTERTEKQAVRLHIRCKNRQSAQRRTHSPLHIRPV